MRTKTITAITSLLLLVIVASGCSQKSGDFSKFMTSEVKKCGGQVRTNAAFPVIESEWTIKREDGGFTAYVKGSQFSTIDDFLQQAFGKPTVSAEDPSKGIKHHIYGAPEIGVVIQCLARPDYVEVICMPGQFIPLQR